MSYCPNCLAEYQPGVVECSDCNIALVDGAPRFCPKCEEPVQAADIFCDSCGMALPVEDGKEGPECEVHPDREAIGGCVICGKPLCDECIHEVDGKYFCDNDDHMNVHQQFVRVYTTATDYEAAMLKANLEGAGIDARIFNQHDHVYFVEMGALALVNLMVPKNQYEVALEIIQAILAETPSDSVDEAAEPAAEGGEAGA